MPADWGIEVQGLQETIQAFNNLPKVIVATGFTKALSAAGNVIADELERNTPVKAEEETGGILERGELKELVMVAVTLDSKLRGGTADVGFQGSKAGRVANWLEYGHRIVKPGGNYVDSRGRLRKGTPTGFVKAYAFMRKTGDQSASRAIDAFLAVIQSTIETADFGGSKTA